MRHLFLAFDGTWNEPDTNLSDGDQNTNVRRAYQALEPKTPAGVEQLKFYFKGVGTDPLERVRGGLFGKGLSDRILSGYRYLVKYCRPGDKVFFIGFSRGAYTARSLAGMIERVGLLPSQKAHQIDAAYQIYRGRNRVQQRAFRSRFSRVIRVEALAVWDTVGALGIPLSSFGGFNRRRYEFHDTRLGKSVRQAYQALAIDEHRADYQATLWQPPAITDQSIEQRWFAGSHSDIGGGYTDARLAEASLYWIVNSLQSLGLAFQLLPSKIWHPPLPLPEDSYADFLAGIYALTHRRHFRAIGRSILGKEFIDERVCELMKTTQYRPENSLGVGVFNGAFDGYKLHQLRGQPIPS